MIGTNENANHNHWKLLIQLPVARSTLWARPPESRSSTASVFSPSTLSTKRWMGAFFAQFHRQLTSPITWTEKVFHPLWKGVSVLVVLVLWPDHPHRDAPGVQAHLYHHPTSQVLHIVILSFHSHQFVSRSMLLLGRARAFTHSDLATCRQVF